MTPDEPPRPVTIRTIRGRYNAFAIERGLMHLSQRDQGIAISCFYAGVRAAFEACKEAGELPDEAGQQVIAALDAEVSALEAMVNASVSARTTIVGADGRQLDRT